MPPITSPPSMTRGAGSPADGTQTNERRGDKHPTVFFGSALSNRTDGPIDLHSTKDEPNKQSDGAKVSQSKLACVSHASTTFHAKCSASSTVAPHATKP
uniref:Uncharacterized protein n=1 Tax=Plectus sambesii TaxID=2011161 RepID=A0A914UJY0_9BILA